jgi:hypothetical protein
MFYTLRKMSFERIDDNQIFSQKIATLPMTQEIDLLETKNFPMFQGNDKVGIGFSISTTAVSNFENGDTIVISKVWESVQDSYGNSIPGYQWPKYYMSWKSNFYPKKEFSKESVNCSLVIGK